MIPAHSNLEIGFEIEPRTYAITQEKIDIYSRYAFFGKEVKNIHTDDETARKAGIPSSHPKFDSRSLESTVGW